MIYEKVLSLLGIQILDIPLLKDKAIPRLADVPSPVNGSDASHVRRFWKVPFRYIVTEYSNGKHSATARERHRRHSAHLNNARIAFTICTSTLLSRPFMHPCCGSFFSAITYQKCYPFAKDI
jgi:hypothetical protein